MHGNSHLILAFDEEARKQKYDETQQREKNLWGLSQLRINKEKKVRKKGQKKKGERKQ